MLEKMVRSLTILAHPLPILFLFVYAGKENALKILKKHPETYLQFYRGNRLRGYDIKTSVERAKAGYGCYKGWKAEPIAESGLLNHLI